MYIELEMDAYDLGLDATGTVYVMCKVDGHAVSEIQLHGDLITYIGGNLQVDLSPVEKAARQRASEIEVDLYDERRAGNF